MVSSSQDVLIDELICYYNADELELFIHDALDEQADDSAARMVHILGARATDVADLLRELAADPGHPLIETIENRTMYGWTGDLYSWAKFQQLARRIADGITGPPRG
jgi:hypothetical protein